MCNAKIVAITLMISCSLWANSQVSLKTGLVEVELCENPFQFSVIDSRNGNVLLQHSQTVFFSNEKSIRVLGAENVIVGEKSIQTELVLEGIDTHAGLVISVEQGNLIHFSYSSLMPGVNSVSEEYIDGGEEYYGVWEYPRGGAISNRNADCDLLGYTNDHGTNYANARAPFYMTTKMYGIYVPSFAKGRYYFAKDNKSGFIFEGNNLDYYFINGNNYEEILFTFNLLSGPAFIPPTWAFDSIWWRDDDYNDMGHMDVVTGNVIASAQDNVLATANYLQYHQIPASAIWIDRPYDAGDWGWGNGGFDTSEKGFPDPEVMVNTLDSQGYKLLLWIANRVQNKLREAGNKQGYLFEDYTNRPAADMRNQEAYQWFTDYLDVYPKLGIRGYKIDRGHEGEMPESVENENVFLFNKMASEGMQKRFGNDFLIFARNAFDKTRQYVGVWNGDTSGDYAGFRISIKNALRCGFINFPYNGSDTGGYTKVPSRELFARWLQFSAYCTMMEVHIDPKRTIWYSDDYKSDMVDIARKQCQDHHDLIPYLQSSYYHAVQTGMPVMRAMLLMWPEDDKLHNMWDQFMCGPEILVAPVIKEGASGREVYLPDGMWIDYNNKKNVVKGPVVRYVDSPIDIIPLFVRAGAIIPRGDIVKSNNNWCENWQPSMRIEFFPDNNISRSFEYFNGEKSVPLICNTDKKGIVNISFDPLGIDGVLEIYCHNFGKVLKDGKLLSGNELKWDCEKQVLEIPYSGKTSVEIKNMISLFDSK